MGHPLEPRRSGPLVLVVEDEASNRLLLTRILEREGYRAVSVADGDSALRAIPEHDPDLVLLDVTMPRMDGYEVCRRLRKDSRTATLPVILISGRTDLNDIVAGLDAGADDFVTKPFQQPELLARIRSAFRLRQAITRMETAHTVAAALANAVEAKDPMTEHHCQRLAHLAARVGTRAGLDTIDLEGVAYGALLHDVGKIGVPEAFLNKPGPLTEEEQTVMRRHPEIGERICRPLEASPTLLPIVRHHHEHWDGSGYPDGLRGEQTPLGARIVSLVDAFDAMTHDRPYRAALPVEQGLDELVRHAGRQFDPDLVPLLLDEIERRGAAFVPVTTFPPTALLVHGRGGGVMERPGSSSIRAGAA